MNANPRHSESNNWSGGVFEDDAASVNWGAVWRMPTPEELSTLANVDGSGKVSHEWTDDYNGTGVAGDIFTGTEAGYTNKSIFLPAAGYRDQSSFSKKGTDGFYWSSSLPLPSSASPDNAMSMGFWSTYTVINNYGSRSNGFTIRAVHD